MVGKARWLVEPTDPGREPDPDPERTDTVTVSLPVATVVRFLLLVLGAFMAADLVSTALRLSGRGRAFGLVPLFDVDLETSAPTWFAAALLLGCAVLLGVAALQARRAGERLWRNWTLLAGVVLALSVDEVASYHESWIERLRDALGATGVLYLTWVVPGAILVVVLSLSQINFLRALPAVTARRFVAAAALHVGGALGMEMLDGAYLEARGSENWGYASMVALEELLEFLGTITLLWALALYLVSRNTTVQVRLRA
jgi:hypothetical protein